jgi:hypothetical protein
MHSAVNDARLPAFDDKVTIQKSINTDEICLSPLKNERDKPSV